MTNRWSKVCGRVGAPTLPQLLPHAAMEPSSFRAAKACDIAKMVTKPAVVGAPDPPPHLARVRVEG